MVEFSGRTALVVGGAGPVGAAVCRSLVQRGSRVLIADGCSRVAAGTRLAHALGACAQFELLDPTDEREWTSTIANGIGRFGGLDAVVLVEPDEDCVAMALRTCGPYLDRRGGTMVGLADAAAGAVLEDAGIPVVALGESAASDGDNRALADEALRYIEQASAASMLR